jgi:hypothetical protein
MLLVKYRPGPFSMRVVNRFIPLPLSETVWLLTIAAVQHVWRRVNEEKKFTYLET